MRSRAVRLVAVWFAAALTPLSISAQELDIDGVSVVRDVRVPVGDGATLSTDIYRPTVEGRVVSIPLPVLLHRTPYEIEGLEEQARYFAQHGYVVAVQNLRGRYASDGTFKKYDELGTPDAYATVSWLAEQPYTVARIGMWGTSYGAHTQAEAAKANPPGLATVLLNMGGLSNAWDNAVRHGGAFELGRELTWAWGEAQGRDAPSEVAAKSIASQSVFDWMDVLPLRRGLSPLSVSPEFETYLLDEWTHSDYDDHWVGPGLNWEGYYEQTADIPMLHVGGWYDIWLRTTTNNYLALSRLKEGPIRMLIGPWDHGGNARHTTGDVDFGPSAAIPDFNTDFQLRWFDYFLKGRDTGFGDEAPVRLFVMGTGDGHRTPEGKLFHGGYWVDAESWPLPDTRFTPYYLHGDGSLSTQGPSGGSPSTTYTYDPRHPVPTIGGNVSGRLRIENGRGDGPFDQREHPDFQGSEPPYLPLAARPDVLVFQTEPLTEDVAVVGPVTVRLYASSTAVDTDFTAKLVDVYPPSEDYLTGYDMNLTDGIIRGRYRGGRTKQELMTPGEVYEFEIRPFPTGNVFKRGHRIRIDISSSNFPRFDVNPNTGEPLGQNRRFEEADNTVYHSPEFPSHVVLPIVSLGSTGASR
jgi:putative CocE/NonD family hydrolase